MKLSQHITVTKALAASVVILILTVAFLSSMLLRAWEREREASVIIHQLSQRPPSK